MSNKNIKVEKVNEVQTYKDENYETIYVDKLSSLAMGVSVSRLGFGIEEPHKKKVNEKYTMIIPTTSLIEMIEVLTQSLANQDLKDNLIQEIEKYKAKL